MLNPRLNPCNPLNFERSEVKGMEVPKENLRARIVANKGGTLSEQEKVNNKKKSIPCLSKEGRNIIEHWNQVSGGRLVIFPEEKKNGEVTKIYKETVLWVERLLRGKFQAKEMIEFNRKFSKEEIIQSIDGFSLAALNIGYYPRDKKYLQKKTFPAFIHDIFSLGEGRSCFLKFLKNPPEKIEDEVKI